MSNFKKYEVNISHIIKLNENRILGGVARVDHNRTTSGELAMQ